jgi:hypothetical protein
MDLSVIFNKQFNKGEKIYLKHCYYNKYTTFVGKIKSILKSKTQRVLIKLKNKNLISGDIIKISNKKILFKNSFSNVIERVLLSNVDSVTFSDSQLKVKLSDSMPTESINVSGKLVFSSKKYIQVLNSKTTVLDVIPISTILELQSKKINYHKAS